MKTHTNTMKALTVLTVGTLLAACGSGTSKSSSDYGSAPTGSGGNQTDPEVALTPIDITAENYTQITSQSLKLLLLNDAGSAALNRSVSVTGSQSNQLGSMATGAIVKLTTQCLNGGTAKFVADINDSNGNEQIGFNSHVHVDFETTFANCSQAGSVLDGVVTMDMSGNLSELLSGLNYNFSTNVVSNGLYVEQPGMPPFTLEGEFTYNISSSDGVNVVTEMVSSNSIYIADTSYKMLDFHVEKTVNNATHKYSYLINSEFNDFYNQDKSIHYQTLEPLTGIGFSLPTDGLIAVNGAESSVMVYVEENEALRLELDLYNDGVIDDIYYSNWHELVLSSFNSVQF